MLLEMAETSIDLPDECWAMIFNHGSDWESLSLVCKRFLSITDNIRVSLSVLNPSTQVLCKLLQRFRNLRKIKLVNFLGDLNKAIHAISQSGLNLEGLDLSHSRSLPTVCLEELGSNMKNIKVLNCSYSNLTNTELVRIANSFPQLEELQITSSFPCQINGTITTVTDEGIQFLSLKLKRLRKIDFSENPGISDKSWIYLSSNCEFLEHIGTVNLNGETVMENGISFVMQNTHHLNSLCLFGHSGIGSFGVKGSTNFPKNLRSLSFFNMDISDEFLFSIAKARIPLKEFNLSCCKSYTVAGLSSVLNSSQSLTSLVLEGVEFLTDELMEKFSQFLPNLTSLSLHFCPELSESGFFNVTQRCRLLSRISIQDTSVAEEGYDYDGLRENLAIKYLNLSANQYLSSSFLRRVLQICPNVEELILCDCFQRDQQLDVADILEYGRGIKSLTLDGTKNFNFCKNDIEISELKTLMVSLSDINDEMLTMIGRKCPGLISLNLGDCRNLTVNGVKEVVKSCQGLRHLNLMEFSNVTFDIIEWIVSSRPSLRRLDLSSFLEVKEQKYTWTVRTTSFDPDEEQEYLLLHGCLVSRGL